MINIYIGPTTHATKVARVLGLVAVRSNDGDLVQQPMVSNCGRPNMVVQNPPPRYAPGLPPRILIVTVRSKEIYEFIYFRGCLSVCLSAQFFGRGGGGGGAPAILIIYFYIGVLKARASKASA